MTLRSDWFDETFDPVHTGYYETICHGVGLGGIFMRYWGGQDWHWHKGGESVKGKPSFWRGRAHPHQPPASPADQK
jgi:hypothetical protein